PLPEEAALNPRDVPRSMPFISKEDRLVKVVAARREGGRLLADSVVDLSDQASDRNLTWDVPEGHWQLMAFWITQRDNADAVDHLSVEAMRLYCETLGARYVEAVGDHFGKTVESFFSDSFEVPIYRNGLYWTDGLFETFEKEKGYDLVPWLPALWWDVDGLSPKVRYDVNEFLHRQGMSAFFGTFLDWCRRHGVSGRIQPYGFVTDIIEGAGIAHIPEMEITAGEKDAVPWFDTRIGPREYVASGAHLYGRGIVTAEAFTYLHWEPYRATLEELKIATDAFLRAGANRLYNHGYIASPERDIVPARGFFAAIRISHENIWWPYYRCLAEYTARCCRLLREGDFVADVAVYSPLANQWTESVLNARKWTREFDWGELGRLLTANGYGFDLVNDDVLQHRAVADGSRLRLGAMTYQVLVLPAVKAMPLEPLQRIKDFVRQGG
ncbi:MAG TPA: glycosyl hydrolase, partial [Candidatus Hydrogenedentes bacterium]|nr:glycosyl hydrolase [Candidatus Hydrogenedentota bacterium]